MAVTAVRALHEALVLGGTLVVLGLAGLPLVRRLPGGLSGGGALAAPVVAFGWFAVVGTVLYRMGVPPRAVLAALFVAALLGALVLRREARPSGSSLPAEWRWAIGGAVLTVALSLLPAWTGGPRFSIFQGNHWDQRNYVASAVGYRHFSYRDLDPASTRPLATPFAAYARANLLSRPAVAVAYAALGDVMPGALVTSAHLYLSLLQSLWYFAQAYLLIAVGRVSWATGSILSAALTLGFFGQYVLDINAWSHLAGVPLLVVALGVAARGLLDDGGGTRGIVIGGALALTPAAYVYPESLPAFALPFLALPLLAGWRRRDGRAVGRTAAALALAGALAAAACIPYWHGTMAFLWRQATGFADVAPPHWSRYFAAHFRGVDEADWSRGDRCTPYGVVSAAVDPAYAALGLYFARPAPTVLFATRVTWKAGLAVMLILLVTGALRAALAEIRRATPVGTIAAAGLASLVFPLILLSTGRYWQSGKALAMVTPLFFAVLALPLLALARSPGRSLPAALLVAAHLGFGLARPVAAARPGGVHYGPPYPAVQEAGLKLHSWDLDRLKTLLAGCRDVAVSLEDPWHEAFTVLYLADTGVAWSPRRPLRDYYGDGVGTPDGRPRACLLASGRAEEKPGERVIPWP